MLKRLLTIAAILACGVLSARGQSPVSGYCQDGNQTVVTQGLNSTTKVQRSYPACTISVFDAGTSNLSTIFSDSVGTPKANPFTAGAQGRYTFWSNNNTIDIQLSGAGITSPFVVSTVKIGDASTGIGGSGTANRVAKFSAATTLANSQITDNATSVGINNTSPDASALLDLTSTARGMLLPRMTTTQRDAISAPATGLMIYNTTTSALNIFIGSWGAIAGGSGLTNLNGLTGSTQTFAVGTSGTDFAISSVGTTHTFNIPDASAANRGLVTTGTQTFAGSKTFTGAQTVMGDILSQAIGGCNPLLPPNLVGAQTIKTGTCSSITDSSAGDFRQLSSWVENTGTRPTVAISGIAKNSGSVGPGFALGGNWAGFANCSGCIAHAEEVDFGILTAGGVANGSLYVAVGSLTGNTDYIRMQSATSNARPAAGITFAKTGGIDPMAVGGAAIAFAGAPSVGIGYDFSGATFTVAPFLLANNSFPLAKNSGGNNKIVGGLDALDFMLFQSGGAGVRWINSANTAEILRVTEVGNIVVGTSGGGTLIAAGSILGGSPHYGGDTNSSTLTLRGTSSATPSSAYIFLNPVVAGVFPGTVSIGAPSANLLAGSILHMQGNDNTGNLMVGDNYSAAGNLAFNYQTRHARGTAAAPTATQSGDPIGVFSSAGYQSTTNAFTLNNARMLMFAAENFTSTTTGSKIIWQTTPIGSTTLTSQLELTDSGDLRVTRPQITAGSGTGLTVNDVGSLQRQVYKVTVTFAGFNAGALTADHTIATLPAKTRLVGIIADTTTIYSGGAITAVTLTVGKSAGGTDYILSHDVKSLIITKGLLDADLGASITRAAAIQGGDLTAAMWAGTQIVSARITTVTANTSSLTQGSTTFYLICEKMP